METLFLTDRLQTLLPKIKAFVEQELYPLETPENLTHNFSVIEPVLQQNRRLVKEAGLWGLHLPEADGGIGLTLCEFGQISEVLAKSPFGHFVFNTQAPDIGNTELMHKYAPAHLQEAYLHPLMDGQIRSCFSMTEPEFAGSNPTMMGTTAVKDGDDYLINGHKWFTSSADGAAFAIVMAVTQSGGRSAQTRQPDSGAHEHARCAVYPEYSGDGSCR